MNAGSCFCSPTTCLYFAYAVLRCSHVSVVQRSHARSLYNSISDCLYSLLRRRYVAILLFYFCSHFYWLPTINIFYEICKLQALTCNQMLWNWFVIDSCFLARSWHVRSKGAFAASCIGVVFLVISLEMVRRVQREYDGYLRLLIANRKTACTNCDNGVVGTAAKTTTSTSISSDEHDHKMGHGTNVSTTPVASNGYVSKLAYFKSRKFLGPPSTRVKIYQHAIRSFFYMVQFAVAYIVMLLAMYFNGRSRPISLLSIIVLLSLKLHALCLWVGEM